VRLGEGTALVPSLLVLSLLLFLVLGVVLVRAMRSYVAFFGRRIGLCMHCDCAGMSAMRSQRRASEEVFRGGRLVQRDDLYISTSNNRLFRTHLHMPSGAFCCHLLSRGLLVSELHAHSHLYRRAAKGARAERPAAILRRHSMACARLTGPCSII
jgi:hypothetical protein